VGPEGPLPVTGLILAGGGSRRMGRPKALLPFGAERLIERQVRLLRPLCQELLVVTNDPATLAFVGLPMVGDRAPGLGPLAGLEAGLFAASLPLVLGVACDMPFLTAGVVRALYDHLVRADSGNPLPAARPLVAVPRTPRGVEPLCALWRREAGLALRAALDSGERSPQRLLDRLPVAWLAGEALASLGDPGLLFQNCNTPDEYADALAKEGAPVERETDRP
jgi:molybdopterin-guanine dinucleotide biosynthesis protein A